MKTLHAILAITTAAAIAADETIDRWGQKPAPEIRQKVEQAVALSATDAIAAEKLLAEARDADPSYYRAQLNLGLIKLALNNNKDAATELEKALALQAALPKKDPSIYAEIGFANHRADRPKAAALAYSEGAKQISSLPPEEQKKLLLRGASFYLDYQQVASARKLIADAAAGLEGNISTEVKGFLDEAITKLTQNDPTEGWVKFGKAPATPGQPWPESLFQKVSGGVAEPKPGEIISPTVVVNMREGPLRPENKESMLARQVGFARVGEKFTVVEANPVALPDGSGVAWWVKVKREKAP